MFMVPLPEARFSALQLASLLHRDAHVAAAVATRARARLDAASGAQIKRLYYSRGGAPSRSKVFLPRPALLQFLVFAESEPFERAGERCQDVDPSTMALRYVKHLVSRAASRNPFHAAVAICRLLFGYSTAETMAIYGSVLPEKDAIKEDGYYRARKRLLMAEVEQRFSGVARVRQGSEERFVPMRDQSANVAAVFAALAICTPWSSPCTTNPVSLSERDDDDADLGRLHALIHPPCFRALAAHAGVPAPESRLAMPQL